MTTPVIIRGQVLRELLARQDRRARRTEQLRALWPESPIARTLLIASLVVWILSALVWTFAIIGL